jgi:hypothetical protein
MTKIKKDTPEVKLNNFMFMVNEILEEYQDEIVLGGCCPEPDTRTDLQKVVSKLFRAWILYDI